jgi:hypothetical protein
VAQDLLAGAWQSIVFGVVGIALMVAGFLLVDVLTPGRLRDLIWVRRNTNAATLLIANQIGIAAIVFTAILTSYPDFARGLASTILFGLIGLGIMALAFLVLDWLTPGKLGEVVCADEPHPAARVSAATHLGAALFVCACIA